MLGGGSRLAHFEATELAALVRCRTTVTLSVSTNISEGVPCATLKQTNKLDTQCYTILAFKTLTSATRPMKRMTIRPGECVVASSDAHDTCKNNIF